jgi:peptidoglycan/LPS O-acetylase OafA/YrhL
MSALWCFFVLSGYLVGGSVLRAMDENRWSWKDYLLRRGARLYTVLFPALILTFVLDKICTYSSHYHETLQAVGRLSAIRSHGLSAFIGNLTFLQGVFVQPYGSNGALWSLSYEFWYYIAFPCLAIMLLRRSSITARLLAAGCLAFVLFLVGEKIAIYGLVWLMGVAVHLVPPLESPRRILRFTIIAGSFIGLCAYTSIEKSRQLGPENWHLLDLILSICVLIMIYGLLLPSGPTVNRYYKAVVHHLSSSSYTVYLTHGPFLFFLVTLTRHHLWSPAFGTSVLGALALIVTFCYTQLVYLCFERHTSQVLAFAKRLRVPAWSPLLLSKQTPS